MTKMLNDLKYRVYSYCFHRVVIINVIWFQHFSCCLLLCTLFHNLANSKRFRMDWRFTVDARLWWTTYKHTEKKRRNDNNNNNKNNNSDNEVAKKWKRSSSKGEIMFKNLQRFEPVLLQPKSFVFLGMLWTKKKKSNIKYVHRKNCK